MGIIDKARKKIDKLQDNSVRERYEDALKLSIDGDFDNLKKISSPAMIEETLGLSLHVQFNYHIALDKRKAVELLKEKGLEITLPVARKRFSSASYQKVFKRDISKKTNTHLFTYMEVLVLAKHYVPLE